MRSKSTGVRYLLTANFVFGENFIKEKIKYDKTRNHQRIST